ncbi:Protein of unknown function [Gryllus bimaculatus]|nr:Protein of unknown function [Gryllus bimaculatus]
MREGERVSGRAAGGRQASGAAPRRADGEREGGAGRGGETAAAAAAAAAAERSPARNSSHERERGPSPETYGLRPESADNFIFTLHEPQGKQYDPRARDLNVTALLARLGAHFDPSYMSVHKPPNATQLGFPQARRRAAGPSAERGDAAFPAAHELPLAEAAQRHARAHARVAAPPEEATALPVGVDGVPGDARVARLRRALLAALRAGRLLQDDAQLVLGATRHEMRAVGTRDQGHPAVAVLAGRQRVGTRDERQRRRRRRRRRRKRGRGWRRRRRRWRRGVSRRRTALPVDGDQQLPHRDRLLVRLPIAERKLGRRRSLPPQPKKRVASVGEPPAALTQPPTPPPCPSPRGSCKWRVYISTNLFQTQRVETHEQLLRGD